jgi:heparin/heparan-sulfate lyase
VSDGRELPSWTSRIRDEHPRLFFNSRSWPAVKGRALGAEKAWYDRTKARADRLVRSFQERGESESKDLGPDAARAAFVYRVAGDKKYLHAAKAALERSLDFYEECYKARKSVNWYSTSRVHATLAWDWLFEDLTEEERRGYLSRLVRVLD